MEYVLYFILTLGILISVHELGHFLAAKICGMRVDRFSIGFPPRAFGKQIGETDYCVSWLPLGGYVKIAGMIDESFDTEHIDRPPEPWEFRSRPMLQKMFVISAGVLMNILLAIAIFFYITYTEEQIIHQTTEIAYVNPGSPEEQIGFRAGDRVVRINGESVDDWEELRTFLYFESMGTDLEIELIRDRAPEVLQVQRSAFAEEFEAIGITSAYREVMIQQVEPGRPAEALDLRPGDIIRTLGDVQIVSSQQMIAVVQDHKDVPMAITWLSNEQMREGTIVPEADGRIGVVIAERYFGPQTAFSYSFLEAIPVSVARFGTVTVGFVQQIWLIITGETPFDKSVGGPIKIAQLATQSAELGITTYLAFMAILSISLAVLNMLPIPGLDGGHFLFLVIEGIARREIPPRIKLRATNAGMTLLIAFMAYVVVNDIINF